VSGKRLVLCLCAYRDIIPRERREHVLARLTASGAPLQVFDDLCGAAARRDPELVRITQNPGPVAVVACHPRAVLWLLSAAFGQCPDRTRIEVINMRTMETDAVVRAALGSVAGTPGMPTPTPLPEPAGDWVPWFPVIDRDRCRGCRQCVSFCPFGVYETTPENAVVVAHPANCKDNCPACARLCPELAIIFPKLPESPINGDEIAPEHLAALAQRREATKGLSGRALREALARRGPSPTP
jgi:NAD-dependent dihydropyrimidine dehydrogenase PreA subunit